MNKNSYSDTCNMWSNLMLVSLMVTTVLLLPTVASLGKFSIIVLIPFTFFSLFTIYKVLETKKEIAKEEVRHTKSYLYNSFTMHHREHN